MMRIVDLRSDDTETIQQVAALLVKGFKEHWPDAWPDMDSALQEVQESLGADRISRVAIDEDGTILGWIGGISQYRYEFYQKLGFVIVGVMPDANGLGKPDIYMAKRVSRRQAAAEQFKPGDTVVWWKRLPGGDYVYPVKATVIDVTAKRVKIEADDEGQTVVRYVKPSSLQKQN